MNTHITFLTKKCVQTVIIVQISTFVFADWIEIAQNVGSQKRSFSGDFSTTQRSIKILPKTTTTVKPESVIKGTIQRAEVKKFKSYPAHIEKLYYIKSVFPNETLGITTEKVVKTTLATTERALITTPTNNQVLTTTERTKIGVEETSVESSVGEFDNNNLTDTSDDEEDESSYANATFVPYLKAIQDSLIKNTQKTVKSKIKFLKQLRDSLLIEIERRMSKLWSPNTKNANREAREYKEDDSHMDFPSNEGALMTIGFLTFAVFLIKLVLKLIHVIKEKHNNQNMMSQMNMSAMGAYIGRKRRDIFDDGEDIRILSLIEEYKLN